MNGTMKKLGILGVMWGLAGCAHTGGYVWANRLPDRNANDAVIRAGDLVRVNVAQQEQLSVTARVRTDGRIPLALVNDVEIAGSTPAVAASKIQAALQGFVVQPDVLVGVEERAPVRVAVLGRVARPGMFDLEASQGVLHALASAGGLTDQADEERIFVLRNNGNRIQRVRFTVDMLNKGEGGGARFCFQPGDVVIVEE